MQLTDFLTTDRIACNVSAHSKKRALEELSELISHDQHSISATDIFDCLLSRERLGGTGIGFGVAIPHGRLKDSDHTTAALVQLNNGIDFDAIDNQPVDLVFALLVPEAATQEHLQLLAGLATLFSQSAFCERLRRARDRETLLELLAAQELAQVGA